MQQQRRHNNNAWLIQLVAFCVLTILLASACRFWLTNRYITKQKTRRVITAQTLYAALTTSIGTAADSTMSKGLVHPVYDFDNKTILVLRTNGEAIEIEQTFRLPETTRFHVRFDSPRVFNRRYSECITHHRERSNNDHESPPRRLEDLFTILDRRAIESVNDDLFDSHASLLRAWGGEKLSVSIDRSTNMIRLHFSDLSNSIVSLRLPKYLTCSWRRLPSGATKLVFATRTPCADNGAPSGVQYGDYLSYYVNTGRTNNVMQVPPRDSAEYRKIIPYMRWVCKNEQDEKPTLAVRSE